MNDLTFGAAMLSLLVTFAAALVHEASPAATTPSPKPVLVASAAPHQQQLAQANTVDCRKFADASASR